MVLVLWFPNIQGDRLVGMNESVNRMILDLLGEDHLAVRLLSGEAAGAAPAEEFDAMLPESFGTANKLEAMNRWMEDGVHVIQFFLFTWGLFFLLRRSRLPWTGKVILVGLLAGSIGFFSELFQNAVSGRGYESQDVIHNLWGVGAAILQEWMRLNRKKRQAMKESKTDRQVVVRRLSGEDFFKRVIE